MTRAGRFTLAAAISLLLLLSLPKLACAQKPVAYGTWSGYGTYTETDYDPFGNVLYYYSGPGSGAFTLDIFGTGPFSATVSAGQGFNDIPYNVTSFGPTSASGGYEVGGYGSSNASFDVTYRSILPDGEFDTSAGFAVADSSGFTVLGFETQVYFASFNSVSIPEPSAIVLMAISTVVVGTSVVIRRRRVAKHLERARAAVGLEI